MPLRTSLRYRLDNLQERLEAWRASPTIRRFHALYYYKRQTTWADTRFLGVPVAKNPLDLWVFQEIIHETRPDLIVETGTAYGGSALFLAHVLDAQGSGRVLTVDVEERDGRPLHPRVTYLRGSSVAPETVAAVRSHAAPGERVMVMLDSDHTRDHVIKELEAYSPLVTPGCYLVVEDTNVNGRPVMRRFGPGPAEAVEQFLQTAPDFSVDRRREKFMFTFNPGGYLLRTR